MGLSSSSGRAKAIVVVEFFQQLRRSS